MSIEQWPTFKPPVAEDEPTKESLEVNTENILEGHAFEEIARVGWVKYRETLGKLSYSDIIEQQAKQVEELELKQDNKIQTPPQWVTQSQNIEAGERARKLSGWFTAEYGKDKSNSFFAFQDRSKKLIVQGRKEMTDEKSTPIDNLVTRIYFTVPTRNSPEAYKALFETLTDEGVMDRIQLALNLENYTADSLDKSYENNTIIVYVYGKDPELMTKAVKAIARAKKESKPELWKLPADDLAKAKKSIVNDFMIPLDDTTAFVEAKNTNSYHSGPCGRMFHEITGEMPTQKVSIRELAQKFKGWNPQRPGLFSEDDDRRRYMPALAFDKMSPNIKN
ncbi:MAG: hypothetical protein Q7K35_04025 [bacterium]|nr:hypothetical protein [bacterium]